MKLRTVFLILGLLAANLAPAYERGVYFGYRGSSDQGSSDQGSSGFSSNYQSSNSTSVPYRKIAESPESTDSSDPNLPITSWSSFKNIYAQRTEIRNFIAELNHATKLRLGKGGIVVGRKNPKLFTRMCYRYVKAALKKTHLTKGYLAGRRAVEAKGLLEKQGFVNILTDRNLKGNIQSFNDFPIGTILVYSGGTANYGHIEVKTSTGYVSDFINHRPVTGEGFVGRNRKLIGAYLLEDVLNGFQPKYAKKD